MLYRLSAFTMICRLSAELVQRCIFSAEKKKMEREEKMFLKKLMERDRQRRRDHMEFHSFRFLSQMLFLKLTHVVFITPDSSKQLVCGAESLDLCLLRARACTSVRASSHVWCRAFHTCVRLCVCVCVKSECIPSLCLRAVQREKCV